MLPCLPISFGAQQLILLPGRAIHWPAARTLIVADLHLGKSQTLRATGAPVPPGVLAETLGRLSALLAATSAQRLLVVGDLLHAGIGLTDDLVARVAAWRREFPGQLLVIPGNHDRALPRIAHDWNAELADPTHTELDLAFTHEPPEDPALPTIAGHLHPAVTIAGCADRLKLPCFVITPTLALLPAFTRFAAGGGHYPCCPATRIVAIADSHLVELPRPSHNPSRRATDPRQTATNSPVRPHSPRRSD